VLQWNGTSWSAVNAPDPGANVAGDGRELSSVACIPAGDCLAVGGYVSNAGTERNEALRWNGAQWLRVATHDSGALSSVTCTAASRCWAVRGQASGKGAVRWNGTSWSAVAVPDPGGIGVGAQNRLAAVACTSAANCWAVGSYWDRSAAAHRDVALHWNGRAWSSQRASIGA
jgi:hypothetical protein